MNRGALSAAAVFCIAATALAGEGTLTVDVGKLGAKVPKSLYGIFLEEINNAGEGGLYAEMVQNRGFEDAQLPPACTLVDGHLVPPRTDHFWENRPVDFRLRWEVDSPHPAWTVQGGAATVVADRPLTTASKHALRVAAGTGKTMVVNSGFWGMNVQRGESYDLSLYAQTDGSFPGALRAALLSRDGKVLASKALRAPGRDQWAKQSVRLVATGTDPKARLALILDRPGTVYFDFVSLFPAKTFKGRKNGLRPDLAKMLADLKPAFVRYPGGCYVEGITVESRPRWEQTLGPLESRVPTFGPWGYWNSNGFGYHEWLQFCEDLGAEALYVFNVGVSCAFRSGTYLPDDQIPALIQNALDAIEYAIGPTTSKWGAMRAKAGHPKPFPLTVVEIGNEQSGARYGARVAQFTKAIHAKYPKLKVALSSWIAGIDHAAINAAGPIDIVDEHHYFGAHWAVANFDHFAKYPRNVPWELYIGEFAANGGVGRGNLLATVNDAAYMMDMEKNADLVKMGSYAPLLENVNRRQWEVNLIHFDSARAFGRASYYACRMFAENRPDVNVATSVRYKPSGDAPIEGPIGLGAYGTRAEFKDIRLEQDGQAVPIQEGAWRPRNGAWSAQGGTVAQTGDDWDVWTFFGSKFRDVKLSLKARKLGGPEGFVVSVGNAEGRRVQVNFGGWGNRQHGLEASGTVRQVRGTIEDGRWYDVEVTTRGREIWASLDGKEVFHETLPRIDGVISIAGRDERTGEVIVKVLNPGAEPASLDIRLEGMKGVAPEARLTQLGGGKPTDENSFTAPRRIAPVARTLKGIGPRFRQEFPPYSVSILRIRPQTRSPR